MQGWIDRVGVNRALAVAVALAAASGAAATFSGNAGAPLWLRLFFGGIAVLLLFAVVYLRWLETGEPARKRARRRLTEAPADFVGRRRALGDLTQWLAEERGGVCAITGGPGSGKSALLRQLIALSDLKQPQRAATEQGHPLAPASIDATVEANGLDLTEVVQTLSDQLGIAATTAEELREAVRRRCCGSRREDRLVVVLDGLDEARGETEPLKIIRQLLKPLASEGRDQGVKVVVGTRRGSQRELLEALGAGRLEIDLDAEEYFAREDVAGYVRARLLAPDTKAPYGDDPALAEEVAQAVALRADRSFLVAVIVSASLAGEEDVVDVGRPGWDQQFPSELGDALDDYLARLPDERRIRDLLTALAFA
ncbi:MAG: AAA family ATPase, partial [Actinobacteria bacterium]|nr:AAA family ATPase [Actinomycetota bacterium]